MLINFSLITMYIVACIYCMYSIKKTGIRKNCFLIIFLLITLLINIYYYRPLAFEDVIGQTKFSEVSTDDVEVVIEEQNNPSLNETNILLNLKNIQMRRTIRNYDDKKINSKYKTNNYCIRNSHGNVVRITIYGDYNYIEHGGSLYKCIKTD